MIGRQKTSNPRAGATGAPAALAVGWWLRSRILPRTRESSGTGNQQIHLLDLDGRCASSLLDEVVHVLPDRLDLGRRVVRRVVVAPGQNLAQERFAVGL